MNVKFDGEFEYGCFKNLIDVEKKVLTNNRFIKSDPRVPSPLNSTQRSAKVRNLNFNNTAPPSAFNTLSRHIFFGPRQRSMLPPERKTLT